MQTNPSSAPPQNVRGTSGMSDKSRRAIFRRITTVGAWFIKIMAVLLVYVTFTFSHFSKRGDIYRMFKFEFFDSMLILLVSLLPIVCLVMWAIMRKKTTTTKRFRVTYRIIKLVTFIIYALIIFSLGGARVVEIMRDWDHEQNVKRCLEQGGYMDYGGCGYSGCGESCQMPGQPPNCSGMGCEEYYGKFINIDF